MDTAFQAGLNVSELSMENIGWNGTAFVDLHQQEIQHLFKLYPWEWICTGVQAGSMMIRKLQNPELLIQSYTTLPVIIQGESTRPLT